MLAPASRTKQAAIWVMAKTRCRPVELPRGAQAADGRGRTVRAVGTRADAARRPAAPLPPPRARRPPTACWNRASDPARAPRSVRRSARGQASMGPRAEHAERRTRAAQAAGFRRAACGAGRRCSAPSAARIASSFSRRTVRARIRLATFEQAMMKTSSEAAISTSSTVLAPEVIWSRRSTASMRTSAFFE